MRAGVFRIILVFCCLMSLGMAAGFAGDLATDGKEERPSFFFRYSEQPFERLQPAWSITETCRQLDDKRLQRTIAYRDPNGPLSVRCDIIDYPSLSAREWVIWFENCGVDDTAIIDQIQSLSTILPGSPQDPFLLHYALSFYRQPVKRQEK